jgi:hypothetical protein
MSKKRLFLFAFAGAVMVLTLVRRILQHNPVSATTCLPVQIVAVGGCDGDGVCGVVAITQDKEVIKGKAAYPIAGLIDCRESIDE